MSPFSQHGLTLIPPWISNHLPNKVWDDINYPFLNSRRFHPTLYNVCNYLSMLRLKSYRWMGPHESLVHYDDVIMSAIVSQITSLTIVYSAIYVGADQSKHQSSVALAFVWGIHRGPVNSRHKWPATRKMFPFGDVIMNIGYPFLRIRP